MKDIIALACTVCIFCLSPVVSRAQIAVDPPLFPGTQADEWPDPSGRFTLAFDRLGWRQTAVSPRRSPQGLTFEFENVANPDLSCLVGTESESVPATTQERVNAIVDRMPERASPPGRTVENYQHSNVGGVAVVDYDIGGGTSFSHYRVFYLSDGAQARQTLISCSAPSVADRDALTAVTNSLRFLQPRGKQ